MQNKAPINWLNLAFLVTTPLAAVVLIPYYAVAHGFHLYEWGWFFAYMAFTGLSITAGYHRLWSHKTFKAHFLVRLFYAVWGAAACQNSILKWSSDHRVHHRFTDDADKDPYAATRGFWFSHIGWVFRDYPRHIDDLSNVRDLQRDPIVAWQHKYYFQLVVLTNGIIPLLLGLAVGRPFGVFLLAFVLRVVLNHHFTFFINSLAHMWGRQPYSEANSSRDSGLLALLTYGEGFHNFHHTFQHDYRNGVRWYHYDPAKWVIQACSLTGLARDLKRASKIQIEKARLEVQMSRAMAKMETREEHADLRGALETLYQNFSESLAEWAKVKKAWCRHKRQELGERMENIELRNRYLELQYAIKSQRRQWRLLLGDIAAA